MSFPGSHLLLERAYKSGLLIILDFLIGNSDFPARTLSGRCGDLVIHLPAQRDPQPAHGKRRPIGLNMLPEITEAEAVGEIATIYRRIKEVQGSPVVNLIWRHLATIEGALAWAWPLAEDAKPTIEANMKPMFDFIDRCIAHHDLINMKLTQPSPTAVEVLRAYERGNCWNLLATTILIAARAGISPPGSGSETVYFAPILSPVPSLLRYSQLDDRQRAQIDELSGVGPGSSSGFRPSLWLHLANWPDLLNEVAASCPSVLASAGFRIASDDVLAQAAVLLGLAPLPIAPAHGSVDLAIGAFRQRLPEMLLIGRVLIKAAGV